MDWLGFTERQNNNVAKTRSSFLYTNPEHWMDARGMVPFTRAGVNEAVLGKSPNFEGKIFKSITLTNFHNLINALNEDPEFKGNNTLLEGDYTKMTSGHVKGHLTHDRAYQHFHDKYDHFFSKKPPQIVLTYEWSIPLKKVYDVLTDTHSRILYCKEKESNADSHLNGTPTVNIRIWIDILFNNQNSDNIKEELDMAEKIYKNAPFHVAIVTPTLFTRCWCLYEIAVRRIACGETRGLNHTWFLPLDTENKKLSFLNPNQMRISHSFFDEMKATREEDIEIVKAVIIEKIEKDSFDTLIHDALRSVVGESFFTVHELAKYIATGNVNLLAPILS